MFSSLGRQVETVFLPADPAGKRALTLAAAPNGAAANVGVQRVQQHPSRRCDLCDGALHWGPCTAYIKCMSSTGAPREAPEQPFRQPLPGGGTRQGKAGGKGIIIRRVASAALSDNDFLYRQAACWW
ncbi:hypothetical protein NDU88_006199 [Pleurodeles waltl]|uniref:Uncharacterized protein n=1 Tax=Pleurodeles waltl TaxID=8319 RepID=A0AAV7WDK9_PLEWA|nr:hypothetical protein NDU88_006199 [Pleurodeles waltl]